MRAGRYLNKAFRNPLLTISILENMCKRIKYIIKNRGVWRGLGYLLYYFSHYTGVPIDGLYWKFVKIYYGKKYVKGKVLDFELFIDLDDRGISRQLWLEGVREHGAVEAYKRELLMLQKAVGGRIIILDIGANIGYYVCIAGNVLDNVKILAIEPAHSNIKLLMKNIELNKLDNVVEIVNCACSNFIGKSRLYLSEQSNVHSLEKVSNRWVEVPTFTVDTLIKSKGIKPNDVHVIRMDTEGHEVEILEGMKEIIDIGGPMLMFIEFDSRTLKNGKLDKAIKILKGAGFNIAYACNDYFSGTVEEFSELDYLPINLKKHSAAEVILKRGY